MRRLWLALFTLTLLAPSACAQRGLGSGATADSPASPAGVTPEQVGAESVFVLHYHRPDGEYDGWNVWAWAPGADGASYPFDREDEFGRYAVVPFDRDVERVGFIVRLREWEAKDVDQDRFVPVNQEGLAEAWIVAGDPAPYMQPSQVDLELRLSGAFLDAPDRVTVAVTAKLSDDAAQGVRVVCRDGQHAYSVARVVKSDKPSSNGLIYDVLLDRPVALEDVAKLTVLIPGLDPATVFARDVLTGDAYSAPAAELGPRYTPAATTFATWSPVADAVDLLIFDTPGAPMPSTMIGLAREGHSVWTARVEGDLAGKAYQYRFRSYGQSRVVPDIHAFAATADSRRSVVVDLASTNPPGWDAQTHPPRPHQTDEIIYEVHVRDYSIADQSCPPNLRGTYLGLVHAHPGEVSSGIDHLKDLGVTAVHLLPIQDFPAKPTEYNWGYWTALFNVPESNYSTDPDDPTAPIRELKNAIQQLHAAGIRVILDVVYNHTSSSFADSPFDQAVPWYYFRSTPDGRLRNDAGVGNSIADERPMVRDYILDSLKFWLTEYRVDGFRFDLVGTHTPETIREVCDELTAIRPDITLYGEPWTGGGPVQFGKGKQRGMPFAVFNDHLRNAIRGDLDGSATGFATGPGGDAIGVRVGVEGAIDDFTDDPTEAINYVSAHDNRTLWDKLEYTHPDLDDATKRSMQKLSLGIVLTSQGVPFLHGGSDFCRTKGGNHNSYSAGDGVNNFDWWRKSQYLDVFHYVAALVQLRRDHPAFRMPTADEVRASLSFLPADGLVAFTLDGTKAADDWDAILVAYNGEPGPQHLDLPEGTWTLVVDAENAGQTPIGQVRGRVSLPGYSLIVAHRE